MRRALTELRTYYGELPTNITEAEMRFAGFAKAIGATPDVVGRAGKALQDLKPFQLQYLSSLAGVAADKIGTLEGNTELLVRASYQYYEVLKRTRDGSVEQQIQLDVLNGLYGQKLGPTLANMGRQWKIQGVEIHSAAGAMAHFNTKMQEAARGQQSLMEELRHAEDTIPRALDKLAEAFGSIFKQIGSLLAPAVLIVLKGLTAIVQAIAWVISKVTEFLNWLGPLGIGIKVVAGLMLFLMPIARLLGVTISLLGSFFGFLGGVFGRLVGLLPGLSAGFATVGRVIGGFLRALTANAAGLAALGVAMAGVGAAAWGLAAAVEKLNAVGIMAIPWLAVMVGTLGLVAIGLVALGRAAQGSYLGLAAVGLALAGVGAAAVGIAVLIKMIGDNWVAAAAAGGILIVVLGGMALAVAALAAVGAAATLPLLALGAALLAVGAATFLIGLGFGYFVEAINKMTGLSAGVLIGLAAGLFVGAIALKAAGVPLRRAAFDIMVASGQLLVASLALAAAGLPFLAGTTALLIGSTLLMTGAIMLGIGSRLIGPAAQALGAAAPSLQRAAIRITQASAQFKVAMDGSFLKASGILLASSGIILAASGLLLVGSPILLAAAAVLLAAVKVLALAAPVLAKATQQLYRPALQLLATSATLGAAGLAMLVGGAALLVGGIALGVAAAIMLISGIALAAGAALIGVGVGILNLAGVGMVTAAGLLIAGALALTPAAVAVGLIGLGLLVAGAIIWAASKPMQYAAQNLQEAGNNFVLAGQALSQAGPLLEAGIAAVDRGTDGITRIGLSMWAGSKSFSKGASELLVAVIPVAQAAHLLSSSLNGVEFALAKPYEKMFANFKGALESARAPMTALLSDITAEMVQYAQQVDDATGSIGRNLNQVPGDRNGAPAANVIPVARDGRAALLSPEQVQAVAQADKTVKILEHQTVILASIAKSAEKLAGEGLGRGQADPDDDSLANLAGQLGELVTAIQNQDSTLLTHHLSRWKH
jgi:hypothetical protein